MKNFRIKLAPNIAETSISGNDLPDIIVTEKPPKIPIYYVRTGEVEYDQIAKLNSSYKNLIHIYKVATIGKIK